MKKKQTTAPDPEEISKFYKMDKETFQLLFV